MSQTFAYVSPGSFTVDLGTDAVRLGEIPGFVTMADLGSVGMSNIVIDNPDGTVGHSSDQIVGWKQFQVTESAETAGNQRTYTGYITDRTYRRGTGKRESIRTGAGNEIEVNLSDLNALLTFKVLTGTDAVRPSETVSARTTWLMASTYLSGLVYDNGFVAASSVVMDATDYTGQQPAAVFADMALATHFNYFVYYDEAAAQASLWFANSNTSAAWDSGISISNVLADIDQAAIVAGTASVFWPTSDAELHRDPTRCYSGVYLPYQKGHVYVTNATIESNFVGRDGSAPNSNVKTAAAATVVANLFLEDNQTEDDRITVTIQVAASQANCILAGQLVTARFTHLPGYASGTPMRVVQRSLAQSIESDEWYQMQLILSPTTPVAGIVQSIAWDTGAGGAGATFPSPVTAGNLLIFSVAQRAGGTAKIATDMGAFSVNNAVGRSISVTGFGSPTYAEVAAGVSSDGCGIGYAIAVGDEQTIWQGQLSAQIVVYEVSGATVSGAEVKALSNQASSGSPSLGAWSSPGSVQFARFVLNTDDNAHSPSAPGTGWFLDQQVFQPFWYGGWPHPQAPGLHCLSGDTPTISSDSMPWGGVAVALAAV